jgi:hypothetical protein
MRGSELGREESILEGLGSCFKVDWYIYYLKLS